MVETGLFCVPVLLSLPLSSCDFLSLLSLDLVNSSSKFFDSTILKVYVFKLKILFLAIVIVFSGTFVFFFVM